MTSHLVSSADALSDKAVQEIVSHIASLVEDGESCMLKLFDYFNNRIEAIAESMISKPDNAIPLWKIVEECYCQAVKPSGQLEPSDYFATLESREDLLSDKQPTEDSKKEISNKWIRFWIRLLNKCPNDPTLFQPRDDLPTNPQNGPSWRISRYLFRAFGTGSTGVHNKHIIASALSKKRDKALSKNDIFSLEDQYGSEMRH
ncbi:hypothetical protein F53441_11973 [Fusarium austroafricanum]|uniref:Uncharacterized protein n=1 Tax=Fusarium austroafricanum TaxID=2364996 RepID=A0A8H4NKJ4_9HYPO|nr:hypothetical protein F53441_11973 [Fusarium austroafricanum]